MDSLGKITNWGQWDNEVGYKIGGFSIEEISANRFMIAGNQAVIGIDTAGTSIWQKSYTFMLDEVGSVTNKVICVKKLRDDSYMVAGQAYEGNCWTNYQKYYYDAWWSPISSGGGGNTNWDTAGIQGGDDAIFDFAQLNDGKLVFVGRKTSYSGQGGVWAFVTDSTGKNILWETQTRIMYKTADGRAPYPMSVCPTPDNGFTVVGEYACVDSIGSINAFAAHYKISPVTAAAKTNNSLSKARSVRYMVKGSKVHFSITAPDLQPSKISIYNATGKLVARLSSRADSYVWDCSRADGGVYVYSITRGPVTLRGRIPLQ